MSVSLPAGFQTLEPFVERFAISSSAARAQRRTDSTPEERRAFFDAALPLMGHALDYLDSKPLAELDDSERRLLDMAMTFAHVSLAVEIQGAQEAGHAPMREYMRITRSPSDS